MTKRRTQAGVIDDLEFEGSDNLHGGYQTECENYLAARRQAASRTNKIHAVLVHSNLEIRAALTEYHRLCGPTIKAELIAFDKATQAMFDAFESAAEEALAKARALAAVILAEYINEAGEANKMLPVENPSQ